MQPKLERDPRFMSHFVDMFGERYNNKLDKHSTLPNHAVCFKYPYRLMGNGILTIQDSETWKPRRQQIIAVNN